MSESIVIAWADSVPVKPARSVREYRSLDLQCPWCSTVVTVEIELRAYNCAQASPEMHRFTYMRVVPDATANHNCPGPGLGEEL